MELELQNIINLLKIRYKSDVLMFDDGFLLKNIKHRISETQCADMQDYHRFLEKNDLEAQKLWSLFYVSYTEFFRNSLTSSVLEHIVLPSLFLGKTNLKNKELRIWSAACASGQEPYSLVMLLEELNATFTQPLNYRVFATDLCEKQINMAQKGIYSYQAISNVTAGRLDKWFVQYESVYAIKQELKQRLDFSVFDLLNDKSACPPSSIFGNFDLVMCANVLFYYTKDYRLKILDVIMNSLAVGGFLIATFNPQMQLLLVLQIYSLVIYKANVF